MVDETESHFWIIYKNKREEMHIPRGMGFEILECGCVAIAGTSDACRRQVVPTRQKYTLDRGSTIPHIKINNWW